MAEQLEPQNELTPFSDLAEQIADLKRQVDDQRDEGLRNEVTQEMKQLDDLMERGYVLCQGVVRAVNRHFAGQDDHLPSTQILGMLQVMGAMLSGRNELKRKETVTKEILSDDEEISPEAEAVRLRIVALQNCRTEKEVDRYPHEGIQVTSGNAAHIFPVWKEEINRVVLIYEPYNDESANSLRFKEIFRNAKDIQIGSR